LSEWEWYSDDNAVRLLIHLLISVNYKDKKWRGRIIKKGSMVLSWATLSEGCYMSVQQCRTAMGKLIDAGEVTKEVTNKYQVVTLVKWEQMQIEEVKPTDKPTDNQQANNKQVTTTKESKEYKEEIIKGEKDFSINVKHMKQIINNQDNHSQWIQATYMVYRLKKKTLGFIMEMFNKNLVHTNKVHKTVEEYKIHLLNWMGIVDPKGKLDNFKK
jgi:hypothetical protein